MFSDTCPADMMSKSSDRDELDSKPLKEGERVNPLHHRLNPTLSDCLKTSLLALTLFPIRFAGALLCFLLSYLVCMNAVSISEEEKLSWCQVSRVGLRGSDLSRPLDGWRALARTLVWSLPLFLTSHKIVHKCNNFEVYWLGRLCLFCCGFHNIKVGCYIGPVVCMNDAASVQIIQLKHTATAVFIIRSLAGKAQKMRPLCW